MKRNTRDRSGIFPRCIKSSKDIKIASATLIKKELSSIMEYLRLYEMETKALENYEMMALLNDVKIAIADKLNANFNYSRHLCTRLTR